MKSLTDRIDSARAKRKTLASTNHAVAPLCAAFVSAMRDAFGADLRPSYVKEGGVLLGKPMNVSDLVRVEIRKGKKRIAYMQGRLGD